MKKSVTELNLERIPSSSIYFDDVREMLYQHQLLKAQLLKTQTQLVKAERMLCSIGWSKTLEEAKDIAEEALKDEI